MSGDRSGTHKSWAEHTEPEERGQAYVAHFTLEHLFWRGTYPADCIPRPRGAHPIAFTAAGLVWAAAVGAVHATAALTGRSA